MSETTGPTGGTDPTGGTARTALSGSMPAAGAGLDLAPRPAPAPGPGRRNPLRTGTLLVGGLVAVIMATVVGLDAVDQTSGRDHRAEHRVYADTVTHVRLISDSGDIRLRGTADRHVVLDARLTGVLRLPRLEARVDGDTLVVSSRCDSFMWECSAAYTLSVPPDTVIEASTSSGDVDAERIDGTVRLRTSSGQVTATRPGGDLDATSGSGDIRVTDARTRRVSASTSSGDVRVEQTTVPADVDARTSAGDVRILVPRDGTVYDAEAGTSAGDQSVAVNDSPTATRRLRATTSAGDARIGYRPAS